MKKRYVLEVVIIIFVIILLVTVQCYYHLMVTAVNEPQSIVKYERYQPFAIVVSEEHWDESQMPKGRRSPSGVLYKPER